MILEISEEYTVDDTSYLGVSSHAPPSLTRSGLNYGFFDYDHLGPWSRDRVEEIATRRQGIAIRSSPEGMHLIIPRAYDHIGLMELYGDLIRSGSPYPCPLNFANGWRKLEWVLRISDKDGFFPKLVVMTEGAAKTPIGQFYNAICDPREAVELAAFRQKIRLVEYRRGKVVSVMDRLEV